MQKTKRISSKKPAWWFAEIMDNLPVGVYRTTLEGKILFCNKRFADMLGAETASELIDGYIVDYYEIKKERGQLIRKLLSDGQVNNHVVRLKRQDGSVFLCSITCKAVFDGDGILVFIDGITQDVTEESGEYNKAHLDELSDSLNNFMLVMDMNGIVLDINNSGAEFIGIPKDLILSKPLSDYLIPQSHQGFKDFIKNILTAGEQEGVFQLDGRHGKERYLELNAFIVKKGNMPHHIKGIGRDVTQRIVKRKEKMKQEKLEGIMEMAGGVAHKMNQPLTIINNLINDLLVMVKEDDPVYEKIQKISKQIQVLNEISTKIRRITRYHPVEYVGGIKIIDIDNAT